MERTKLNKFFLFAGLFIFALVFPGMALMGVKE